MSNQQGLNLLVFRSGRCHVRGLDLKRALLESLDVLEDGSSPDVVLAALLRAGELECSAADSGSPHALRFGELTDLLAEALLHGKVPSGFKKFRDAVEAAPVPEQAELSVAEGFAYYALHPLAYADVLEKLQPLAGSVVVIGIRSIGTTLSAVACAAVRNLGMNVTRMTVRPCGHPYQRRTEFTAAELVLIQNAVTAGAKFLVVDEGPGLSGSTFLSVAEALEAAGVPAQQITLLCSYEPNVNALCTVNAADRWKRFRSVAASSEPRRPADAQQFIGAGEWRNLLFQGQSRWPGSWISMERLKYLSPGERRLFKFSGFGYYGKQVSERERAVAAAGFGLEPRSESDGFLSYRWLQARPMDPQDVSAGVLDHLAGYCAFRAKAFAAELADIAALEEMAEHNLQHLKAALPIKLELERPIIADARMQPHEWLLTTSGEIFKTDSGSHGEDHFFPGPTDIAWDLAGTIVEWRMDAGQARYFLERYAHLSGDQAHRRVAGFVTAYTVFRWAYCKMAANAMRDIPEHSRLESASARYAQMLPALRAASGL
jgi:hypothetical protein